MSALAAPPSDCPAIHVAFTTLADENLFRWVQVGAEEEGVPCRRVAISEPADGVAVAYAAAESSRLRIGVAVSRGEVILHELHMPRELPVLKFRMDGQDAQRCRLMGSNAARMVVRLPFRFPGDDADLPMPDWILEAMAAASGNGHAPAPLSEAAGQAASDDELSPAEIARAVGLVTRRLLERGIGA